MQKHVNLADLVKSFPTNIFLQNLASIQKRTSPVKFAHLAEKSGKGSISNLSTKVLQGGEALVDLGPPQSDFRGPRPGGALGVGVFVPTSPRVSRPRSPAMFPLTPS